MNVEIAPVESDGKFWVNVTIDDKTNRHGPYPDSDSAGAIMRRLLQVARALTSGGKHG